MPEFSYVDLLLVVTIALAAPLAARVVRRMRVPAVVLEIIAGIAVGPSGLGWVEPNLPIQILALMGLAFLLFLTGLEIDVAGLHGQPLKLAGLGFAATMVLGTVVGVVLGDAASVQSPLLFASALAATSLGLVVPVLQDAGESPTPRGQLVVGGASVAAFGAVLALMLFFSSTSTETAARLVLVGGFAAVVLATGVALSGPGRSRPLHRLLARLEDTTADMPVRFAVVLLVASVALAERLGLETILAAFVVGALLNLAGRDALSAHPGFRLKLEALGYGFFIPVFFVTSGLRFNLQALVNSPSAMAKVPLFLLALLVVRAVPAALYVPDLGRRRALAAGLLQATSLPFLVVATQLGVALGEIRPTTGAALLSAGLVSAVVFPPVSLRLLSGARATESSEAAPAPEPSRSRDDRDRVP